VRDGANCLLHGAERESKREKERREGGKKGKEGGKEGEREREMQALGSTRPYLLKVPHLQGHHRLEIKPLTCGSWSDV
jgi:hypothetical protein